MDTSKILVIGHRGASGYRPEHTLEAYKLAIEQGADYIEPDLVVTKDRVLIARHEPEISETTDVAAKFPDRKRTKLVDGQKVTGWFAEDFTLKEIKSLRARERLAGRSQTYNGKFEVPTLEEIFDLLGEQKSRKIGIIPELKHPTYFKAQNLDLVPLLVAVLKKREYSKKDSLIYVQSFELDALKRLKKLLPVKTVFLIGGPTEVPYDFVVANDSRNYLVLVSFESGLKEIAQSADALGPHKDYIIQKDSAGKMMPSKLVKLAHAQGLKVFPYTFRSDTLREEYKGDPLAEYQLAYTAGVDGVFSDFPDVAVQARKLSHSINKTDK